LSHPESNGTMDGIADAEGKKRTALCYRSSKRSFEGIAGNQRPGVIEQINPILRGWENYFAFGHSSRCFSYIR